MVHRQPAQALVVNPDRGVFVAFHKRRVPLLAYRVRHVRLAAHQPDFTEVDIVDGFQIGSVPHGQSIGASGRSGAEFEAPFLIASNSGVFRLYHIAVSIVQGYNDGFTGVTGSENCAGHIALQNHLIGKTDGREMSARAASSETNKTARTAASLRILISDYGFRIHPW